MSPVRYRVFASSSLKPHLSIRHLTAQIDSPLDCTKIERHCVRFPNVTLASRTLLSHSMKNRTSIR